MVAKIYLINTIVIVYTAAKKQLLSITTTIDTFPLSLFIHYVLFNID